MNLDSDLDRAAVRRLASGALLAANAVTTGALLGILQWGVFFLLQSFLASTAVVYLLATCVWLGGGVLGLAVPGDRNGRFEAVWLCAMLGAYFAFRAIAAAHPYELRALAALLPTIAVMGAYAGRFFRYRAPAFRAVKWLFFLENCGFLAGMIWTVVALARYGERMLADLPLVTGACVLASVLALRLGPAAPTR